MKFKVLPDSLLYKNLRDVEKKIKHAKVAARKLVKELGYEQYAYGSNRDALGGIAAIHIPSGQPDGWKVVGEKWQRYYLPKASEKELWKKLNALPTVSLDEVWAAFGLKNDTLHTFTAKEGIGIFRCPGVQWGKKDIIFYVPKGAEFDVKSPYVEGMVEIKDSEFEMIENKIEKESQAKKKQTV